MSVHSINGGPLLSLDDVKERLPKKVKTSINELKKAIKTRGTYRQLGDEIFLPEDDFKVFLRSLRVDGPKSAFAGAKRILSLEPKEDEFGRIAFLMDRSRDTLHIGVFWAPYDERGVSDAVKVATYGNPYLDLLHDRSATYADTMAFWEKWSIMQSYKADSFARRYFWADENLLREINEIKQNDLKAEQDFDDAVQA